MKIHPKIKRLPFAYLLKENFKDMLEFANDKKITESMNELEIYEYLECMLKIIKNNKMHKKIPVLCFIGCGRSTFQQRFDLIMKGQQKNRKHNGYIFYIIIFCFSYILSFAFAFEPEYKKPDHTSDEIIYNLENKDTFYAQENIEIENEDQNGDIEEYIYAYVWKYKVVNGNLYKRKFNKVTGKWVGK